MEHSDSPSTPEKKPEWKPRRRPLIPNKWEAKIKRQATRWYIAYIRAFYLPFTIAYRADKGKILGKLFDKNKNEVTDWIDATLAEYVGFKANQYPMGARKKVTTGNELVAKISIPMKMVSNDETRALRLLPDGNITYRKSREYLLLVRELWKHRDEWVQLPRKGYQTLPFRFPLIMEAHIFVDNPFSGGLIDTLDVLQKLLLDAKVVYGIRGGVIREVDGSRLYISNNHAPRVDIILRLCANNTEVRDERDWFDGSQYRPNGYEANSGVEEDDGYVPDEE